MLSRPITYTNYNTGEEATEIFYFNISEPELIEMEVEVEGGMANMLQRIIDSKSGKEIIRIFKKIILDSYGVRSADGRAFIKNEELKKEFALTAAFNVLFMELSTNSEAAATFIKEVMPPKLVSELEKAEATSKTVVHDGRTTTAI